MKKLLFFIILLSSLITACSNVKKDSDKYKSLTPISEMKLDFASQFKVSYYEDGYTYLSIADGNEYVLIPEGHEDTDLGFSSASLIHLPCRAVYAAASSTMDQFRELNALDQIKSCSTTASDFSIEEISKRIEEGDISYVGKYRAPDYEKLISLGTDLAIESTMIYHAPKTKEELERFGIPVLVDRSSYEENPLGRIEWIKLYGLLLGQEEKALQSFNTQISKVEQLLGNVNKDQEQLPSVVFFYISPNGYINVRKPGDYVSKMIEMAGGRYALDGIETDDSKKLSTINISWEDFYIYARDADILIYNAAIVGGFKSLNELINENKLFADFRSVKEGRVYCSSNNMYQESSHICDIITDLNIICENKSDSLTFFQKLE